MTFRLLAKTKTFFAVFLCSVYVLGLATETAYALSPEQRRTLRSGALYFNTEETPAGAFGCGSGANLAGNDNAEKVWNFLRNKNFQPTQAAGIMGNLKAEAGFESRLVEYGFKNSSGEVSVAGQPSSLDDNVPPDQNGKGQPGYGLVQWTGSRKQGIRDLVASTGNKASDMGLQLNYLMSELNSSMYKSRVLDPILASTTLEESTYIFLEKFEIPGDIPGQRPIRLGFAKDILTQYGSGTTTAPTTGSGCQLDASGCPTEPIPESDTVDVQGINVHPCIAPEVDRILTLAKASNLNLGGDGWRSVKRQEELRVINGCPDVYESPAKSCRTPTAIPGQSQHERGAAVDFTCDGSQFTARSHPCYKFLEANTSLKNLPSEAWHWSINGS